MKTLHICIIAGAIVVSSALIGAGLLLSQRFEIVETTGNNVAWKIDRLTGQAYGCEESEFGPFCIPAPDQIKHAP